VAFFRGSSTELRLVQAGCTACENQRLSAVSAGYFFPQISLIFTDYPGIIKNRDSIIIFQIVTFVTICLPAFIHFCSKNRLIVSSGLSPK
jgi:hypothetical protein